MLTRPFAKIEMSTTLSEIMSVKGIKDDSSNSPFTVYRDHLNSSGVLGSSNANSVPNPRPKRMLKTGPARHPVTAISPNPFFAIATFAFISPRQLPTASNVSPKRDFGRPKIRPMTLRRSITKSEVNEIQTMDIANPMMAKMNMIVGGGTVFFVKKQMYTDKTSPGAINIAHTISVELVVSGSSVRKLYKKQKDTGNVSGRIDALNLSQSSYSAIGIE